MVKTVGFYFLEYASVVACFKNTLIIQHLLVITPKYLASFGVYVCMFIFCYNLQFMYELMSLSVILVNTMN